MNVNCIVCQEIEELYKQAGCSENRHAYVNGIYEALKKKRDSREMLLYMADYDFNRFSEELQNEYQFTYTAFLQCFECKKIYELGVCIRGEPIFRVLSDAPDFESFKKRCRNTRRVCCSDLFQ